MRAEEDRSHSSGLAMVAVKRNPGSVPLTVSMNATWVSPGTRSFVAETSCFVSETSANNAQRGRGFGSEAIPSLYSSSMPSKPILSSEDTAPLFAVIADEERLYWVASVSAVDC